MDGLLYFAMLVAALVVLVKSSDFFITAARVLGGILRLPTFIIGVTIVAIGTSLPELASSVAAVLRGVPDIVVGNVVGSNVANITLVLGVAAIMAGQLHVRFYLMNVDLPFFIGSALFLVFTLWDLEFSLPEGLLFIAAMVIYFYYTSTTRHEAEAAADDRMPTWKAAAMLVGAAVGLYAGAHFTVEAVVRLSEIFGVGTGVLSMTVVALGTSLPELLVTISASRQGHPEMAVGNVVGSNIFNTFAVMGIPSLFGTITVDARILEFSLPLMVGLSFLFFFVMQNQKVVLWEGWLFILFYLFFIGTLAGVF